MVDEQAYLRGGVRTWIEGVARAFDEEKAKAANSTELIAAMKRRYPLVGLDISLDFSSKVAKHELAWE